jgi:hypothetical protein
MLQCSVKSDERSQEQAENEIRAAFDAHKCNLTDSTLNIQRIVSGYTEET